MSVLCNEEFSKQKEGGGGREGGREKRRGRKERKETGSELVKFGKDIISSTLVKKVIAAIPAELSETEAD